MIISLFESVKYAGHLWPVAILRIAIGSFFLRSGLEKVHSVFLQTPVMTESLNKWMAAGVMHPTYKEIIENWVIPHWKIFAHLIVFGELFIGIAYILGFMVRPAALLALFFSVNFILAGAQEMVLMNKLLIYIHLVLFLVSAGRCLGFDYYFYKRVRGVWW